jgi:hypothetical protein
MDCYRLEEVDGENPLFQQIDATYVIHLEDNGRLGTVKKELREFYPSKNTCILFNKGFKRCNKDLPKNESQFDIVDANLFIFRDAQRKQYKNILVLEDDFFFHKEIRANENCTRVDEFIEGKQDDTCTYFLGCLPFLALPCDTDFKHYALLFGTTCHSVIYSQKYREEILLVEQGKILDWDIFQWFFQPSSRYMYHMPLCYQLFPVTDNSKNWGNQTPFMKLGGSIGFQIFQLIKLDVQVDPGYSSCYFLSKTWMFVLVFLFLVFVLWQNKLSNYFYKKRDLRRRLFFR